MLDLFNNDEWRPVIKQGIEIPDYYINKKGECYSLKTNKIKTPSKSFNYLEGRKTLKCLDYSLMADNKLILDYNYRKKGRNNYKFNIKVHTAVMNAWKPIDEYPPIPKEDWDKCPDSAKQFMKENAIIDHIDDDPTNNHVDNLRWSTQKQNCHWVKHSKG